MRRILLSLAVSGPAGRDATRLTEMAALETEDHEPTGRVFLRRLDPDGDLHPMAIRAHGLKPGHLLGCPTFVGIVDEFLAFAGTVPIILQDVPFHRAILDDEMRRAGREPLGEERFIEFNDILRNRLQTVRTRLQDVVDRLKIKGPQLEFRVPAFDVQIMTEALRRLEIAGCEPRRVELPQQPAGGCRDPRLQDRWVKDVWGGPWTVPELVLRQQVKAITRAAADFPDLLEGHRRAGIIVLPQLGREGALRGLRFTSGENTLAGGEAGVPLKSVISGRCAYDRERHRDLVEALVLEQPHLPGAAGAGLRREAELGRTMGLINGSPEPVDAGLYRRLSAGNDRWASMTGNALMREIGQRGIEVSGEIHDLRRGRREVALRWICRGLAPRHALWRDAAVFGEPASFGVRADESTADPTQAREADPAPDEDAALEPGTA